MDRNSHEGNPSSHDGGHETDFSTIVAMIGFAVMMFLDVALG